jgi:hypothetical protein
VFGNDVDDGTDTNPVAQDGNIGRTHSDAAVAGRATKQLFLGSAMDIDATCKGIPVSGLGSIEPKNPRNDRITPRRVRFKNLSGGHSGMENRTERFAHADLHAHQEFSQWSCKTPPAVPDTESRSRNGEDPVGLAILKQKEFLILKLTISSWWESPFRAFAGALPPSAQRFPI